MASVALKQKGRLIVLGMETTKKKPGIEGRWRQGYDTGTRGIVRIVRIGPWET